MRARDGNLAGDLGVMVAGAARAGKKGLACGPRLSAAGNDALRGVRLSGEAGRGACVRRERAEGRETRAAGLAGLSTRREGAGPQAGLGCYGLVCFSDFLSSFPILFLFQTKLKSFEFKFGFKFKPHSIQ